MSKITKILCLSALALTMSSVSNAEDSQTKYPIVYTEGFCVEPTTPANPEDQKYKDYVANLEKLFNTKCEEGAEELGRVGKYLVVKKGQKPDILTAFKDYGPNKEKFNRLMGSKLNITCKKKGETCIPDDFDPAPVRANENDKKYDYYFYVSSFPEFEEITKKLIKSHIVVTSTIDSLDGKSFIIKMEPKP